MAVRLLPVASSVLLAAMVSACNMNYVSHTGYNEPTQQQQAAARPTGDIYNVVGGDTIYVVARRFGITVRSLIDANNLQPPFQLFPGQQLRLPTGGDYVVVKGDTLSKVARKTGVPMDTLARMNGLNPPYTIHINQRLMLPTGVTAPQPGTEVAVGSDTVVIQSPNAGGNGPQPAPLAAAPQAPVASTQLGGGSGGAEPSTKVETLAPLPGQASSTAQPPAQAPAQAQPSSNYKPLAQRDAPPPAPQPLAPQPIAPPAQANAAPQPAPAPPAAPPPATQPVQTVSAVSVPKPLAEAKGMGFIWPVHGQVLIPFGAIAKGLQNDGVDIAVPKGTPVLAAADGEVKYAGNELRGFGNLLLIKHQGEWVTAYAHNDKLLVKRGDHVKRGEKIALAGDSGGALQPQLHFELRQGVKPVDPQSVLPPELTPAAVPSDRPDPG